MGMNVIVMGGDGFIGSHLVEKLLNSGQKVSVFDRFPYGITRNLEHLKRNIRIISGEYANRVDVTNALLGNDVAYHCIWTSTPISSWNDPCLEIDENIRLSVQLIEAASEAGIKKIVFPSSGGTVYGRHGKTKISESQLPQPFSPYGIAKLTVEHFLNYYRESKGLAVDIYRIGNAFGPRQQISSPQGVIAVWMSKIMAREKIMAYGDQETLRDYVYVEDIAHLMMHSLTDIRVSSTLNIGTGRGTSIVELLQIFRRVVDVPFEYEILPRRPSDNSSIVLDNQAILNLYPNFSFSNLEDKIRETWIYFSKKNSQTSASG